MFDSDKQRRYLFSERPEVARKMVRDARRRGEPITKNSTRQSRKMPKRSTRRSSGRR